MVLHTISVYIQRRKIQRRGSPIAPIVKLGNLCKPEHLEAFRLLFFHPKQISKVKVFVFIYHSDNYIVPIHITAIIQVIVFIAIAVTLRKSK